MNDETRTPPRPVSIVAVAAIFALLSLFWVLAVEVYVPHRAPAPQNEAPENLPKELAWKATPATRRAYLAELRERQANQAQSYGWVDKAAGVVRLPVGRAMELVARDYGARKQ
ncbi:MAG TPA: hypothetical protein VKG78_08700 [Opitutaceae bacterium]|nr:hypothetical protein [Opitutaceae bacterium]